MFTAQQVARGVALHVAEVFKGKSKQAKRDLLIAQRKYLASQSFPNDIGGYVRREKKPEQPIKLKTPRELFSDLVQAFTDPANLKLIQPPGKARRHRMRPAKPILPSWQRPAIKNPTCIKIINRLGYRFPVAIEHLA